LALLLNRTNDTHLTLVSPPNVPLPAELQDHLRRAGVTIEEDGDLMRVVPQVDVLYVTRVQRERFSSAEEYDAARGKYVVDQEVMESLNPHAIVMHPLPRVDEISRGVDQDPRSVYFREAHNGVFVRMALLEWVLG
jgi:aspartate carbamoyltransferase catalytic subunit